MENTDRKSALTNKGCRSKYWRAASPSRPCSTSRSPASGNARNVAAKSCVPRVSAATLFLSFLPTGLSPLARGNRPEWRNPTRSDGPIPARAGEPLPPWRAWPAGRAYPRSRGGTAPGPLDWGVGGGLSPLARGNLARWRAGAWPTGPIPARAGEPTARPTSRRRRRAYPRSRGGTSVPEPFALLPCGLSPLARGNLPRQCAGSQRGGPIPARAGEPNDAQTRTDRSGAYPRSRGGTTVVLP